MQEEELAISMHGLQEGQYRLDLEYSHEGDGIHGVPLDSRTFFLAQDEGVRGLEGEDVCAHSNHDAASGSPHQCRGCAVIGVEHGIALSVCDEEGDDVLLVGDVDRQKRAAEAAMDVMYAAGMYAAGDNAFGEDGVTLAITSCGRLRLLQRTLDSFFAANDDPIR